MWREKGEGRREGEQTIKMSDRQPQPPKARFPSERPPAPLLLVAVIIACLTDYLTTGLVGYSDTAYSDKPLKVTL